MTLEFIPDTSTIGPIEFRPYMVEVAWNYCQLVLNSTFSRGPIEESIAALAIEITLKSYNAVVVANAGMINETYQFQPPLSSPKIQNKHNLVALAALLRPDVRRYLIQPEDEETLLEYQDSFSNSRYFYEPSAQKTSSGSAMTLAIGLICKTLYLYKQQGCNDPFVTGFNVNAVYFKHVQQFALV